MPGPISLFVGHHPDDELLLKQFLQHLSPLERRGTLTCWHPGLTVPGADKDVEKATRFAQAQLIVFLVSAPFLDEDGCSDLVDEALVRHRCDQTPVIPIIARSCLWEESKLAEVAANALPSAGPIASSTWKTHDEAWTSAVNALSKRIGWLSKPRLSGTGSSSKSAIEGLTAGVRSLATDYASRLEDFLREYLGDDTVTVPFGGREDALRALDAWLGEETKPFALMAAPAGQGKSALLARWSARLLERTAVGVAFLPISIRFETNLPNVALAVLASELAEVHGEQIPNSANTSIDEWRGAIRRYLERPAPMGRRVVVVLDGLDEAAGFQLANILPRSLPAQTKILISARLRAGEVDEAGWMQELRWESSFTRAIPLWPLTHQGISQVLVSMGFPHDALAEVPEFVSTLHHLTVGDPLLVGLYVRRMQARTRDACAITAAELSSMEPGITGYMDLWWRDQQTLWGTKAAILQPATTKVLDLLACALGPLSRDDIAVLLAEDNIPTRSLEDALRSLDRFVIGDGNAAGYVFSHPKLCAYFHDRLSEEVRNQIGARFLAYGQRTLKKLSSGELEPRLASAYVIQRYGAHLERAKSGPEALLALANKAWKEAWETIEGTHSGFVSDLERGFNVVTAADRARISAGLPPQFLDFAVRYALCRASVNSLAHQVDPKLAIALVKFGVWSPVQGLTFVRQIQDEERRAEAIGVVAPDLPERERRVLVTDLLQMSKSGIGTWGRALEVLAKDVPEVLLPLVLDAVEQAEGPWPAVRILQAIASRIPPKHLARALVLARSLTDALARTQALASLVPVVDAAERPALVEEVLGNLGGLGSTVRHGEIIASMAAHVSDAEVSRLIAFGRQARHPEVTAYVLAAAAQRVPEQDRAAIAAEARAAAQHVRHPQARARLLADMASKLPADESALAERDAIVAATSIQDPWERLKELLAHVTFKGERLAEEVQALLPPPSESPLELLAVAAHRLSPEQATHVWVAIEAAIDEYVVSDEDEPHLTALIGLLAPLVPQSMIGRLLELGRSMEDWDFRATVLAALAPRLDQSGAVSLLLGALETSQAIGDVDEQATVAAALAPLLKVRSKARGEIWDLAFTRPVPLEQHHLFRNLLQSFDKAARKRVALEMLEDLLWSKEAEPDRVDARCRAIIELAPHLPATQHEKILEELDGLDDGEQRTEMLGRMLCYLNVGARREVLGTVISQIQNEDGDYVRVIAENGSWVPLDLVPDVYPVVRERSDPCRVHAAFLQGPLKVAPLTSFEDALRRAADYLDVPYGPPSDHEKATLALARAAEAYLTEGANEEDEQLACLALAELVPYLPHGLRARQVLIDTAFELEDPAASAEVLIRIAAIVSEEDPTAMLKDGMNSLLQIGDRKQRTELVNVIAPQLHAAMLNSLLEVSREIEADRAVEIIDDVLGSLEGDERARTLAVGLENARRAKNPLHRSVALATLARHTDDSALKAEVRAALPGSLHGASVAQLETLAPFLSSAKLDEALDTLPSPVDPEALRTLLRGLAPQMSPGQLLRALEFVQGTRAKFHADLLAALPLEKLPRPKQYEVILSGVRAMCQGSRPEALVLLPALLPTLSTLGGDSVAQGIGHALLDTTRWWP